MTLNVNDLKHQLKDRDCQSDNKTRANHKLSIRNSV